MTATATERKPVNVYLQKAQNELKDRRRSERLLTAFIKSFAAMLGDNWALGYGGRDIRLCRNSYKRHGNGELINARPVAVEWTLLTGCQWVTAKGLLTGSLCWVTDVDGVQLIIEDVMMKQATGFDVPVDLFPGMFWDGGGI